MSLLELLPQWATLKKRLDTEVSLTIKHEALRKKEARIAELESRVAELEACLNDNFIQKSQQNNRDVSNVGQRLSQFGLHANIECSNNINPEDNESNNISEINMAY